MVLLRQLHAAGGILTVVSFIGEDNWPRRKAAGAFVDNINRRLLRRETQEDAPHVSLQITDRRIGRQGKAQLCHRNDYHWIIDDNGGIIKEATKMGLQALAIETKFEHHIDHPQTFRHVDLALKHILEQCQGDDVGAPSAASSSVAHLAETTTAAASKPMPKKRRRTARPSAALTAAVLKDHEEIMETDEQRTIRLLDSELAKAVEEGRRREQPRRPYRDPKYIQRANARAEEEKKLKAEGLDYPEIMKRLKRLPSPCSTCHSRRIKMTNKAKQYAASRRARSSKWRIKRSEP